MSEVSSFNDSLITDQLHELAKCYEPSPEAAGIFRRAPITFVSGKIVGGGKSFLLEQLESLGFHNVPSWTNRSPRDGEVDGVDKHFKTTAEMLARASLRKFVEIKEPRKSYFYATDSDDLLVPPGKIGLVKDIELEGAFDLRKINPDFKIIIPLPPLRASQEHPEISEWEYRLITREYLHKSVTNQQFSDFVSRLEGVVEEVDNINRGGLVDDPNTLFIINDDPETTTARATLFIKTGEKTGMERSAIFHHLEGLRTLATTALLAA